MISTRTFFKVKEDAFYKIGREEGEAIGQAKGEVKGKEVGLAEGIEVGKAVGEAEKQKQTAIRLKELGCDMELISKAFNIPVHEAEKLIVPYC